MVVFFNDTETTEIYTYVHTLSLHDALPISKAFHKVLDRIDTGLEHGALEAWLPDGTTRILGGRQPGPVCEVHLHSWRALVQLGLSGSAGKSEEHTSELQSLMRISYAVFCLKKKNKNKENTKQTTHRE